MSKLSSKNLKDLDRWKHHWWSIQWIVKFIKFTKFKNFKDTIETIQAIVSIIAILVGATWTYNIFLKERRNYAYANIEHKTSYIKLSNQINLLIITVKVTNPGNTRLLLKEGNIRIQQIKPLTSCSNNSCYINQINTAIHQEEQKIDQFSWPLLFKRVRIWEPLIEIEPKEEEQLNFEFAIPAKITHIRIYTHFPNLQKTRINKNEFDNKFGWSLSTYYSFIDNKKK